MELASNVSIDTFYLLLVCITNFELFKIFNFHVVLRIGGQHQVAVLSSRRFLMQILLNSTSWYLARNVKPTGVDHGYRTIDLISYVI